MALKRKPLSKRKKTKVTRVKTVKSRGIKKAVVKKTTIKPTKKKRTPISKKKQIRNMRTSARKNSNDTVSSHNMAWAGDASKKRNGNFVVYPTITPKEGKSSSTKASDWKSQTPKEANKKGELIKVKSRRKAERLAAGSWKKGAKKRQAMKSYRKRNKSKLY